MPSIRLSPGLDLYYQEFNSHGKVAVLLLHGLGVNSRCWELQIPALIEAGYHVIAPDARGHGNSTYPGSQTSIGSMAGDIAAMLERLQAGIVSVVGISMGCTLALQLALDHPSLVEKLVLVNTFARLRPSGIRELLYHSYRFLFVHILGVASQAQLVSQHLFPYPEQ